MNLCQTAPLMDRVGRLITDFSHFLQNYTYEYFSAKYIQFYLYSLNKFNVNIDSNSSNITLQKVNNYQKFTRVI